MSRKLINGIVRESTDARINGISDFFAPEGDIRINGQEHYDFFRRYGVSASNLVLWLDQAAITAGISLASWNDLSWLGNDMKQATASYQPSLSKTFQKDASRDFDGSDNFMAQEEQDDESGATFWPTNAGAIFLATKAAFRVAGVDLSPFASAANDYMLVIHDSADKTAWGYIDLADSAYAVNNDYTSDFSNPDVGGDEDLDGWTVTEGTIDGNIDGIGGQDNNLRFTCSANNATHIANKLSIMTAGKSYRVRFDYYIPDGQSHIDGIRPHDDSRWLTVTQTVTGSWTTVDLYIKAGATRLRIYAYDGSATTFQDAGDDVFYICNVIVDEVTHVGADGVLIMSTKGGATQSWALQEAGIDLNDIDSFEVLKTDFQHTSTFFESWWVYCVDPTNFVIADKLDTTRNEGYRIGVDAADKPYCSIGDGTDTVTATWGSAISVNTWYKISAGYDGTNAFVSVNNGTRVTAAQSVPADTYTTFKVGSDGTNYADGNIAIGIDLERAVSTGEDQRFLNADRARFL